MEGLLSNTLTMRQLRTRVLLLHRVDAGLRALVLRMPGKDMLAIYRSGQRQEEKQQREEEEE